MKLTQAYLDGVMMAINAAVGACAVFDSHRCSLDRTWMFDFLHDWSGQVSSTGPYARDRRTFAPNWAGVQLVTGTEELLKDYLAVLEKRGLDGPVFLLRGTLSLLSGTDLAGLAEEMSQEFDLALLPVERGIEDEDWIDGWRRVEESLWQWLEADSGSKQLQVRGWCLFRREGDEMGNIAEIAGLLEMLGAENTAWPLRGAGPLPRPPLSRSSPAVFFPYASPQMLERYPGPVARVDLPVGIANTCRLLRTVGRLLGGEDAAEKFIEQRLAGLRNKLQPFVVNILGGRGAVVVADPWLAAGLSATCRELGMGVPLLVVLRRRNAGDVNLPALREVGVQQVLIDPDREDVAEHLQRLASQRLADVVVGAALLRDEAERCGLGYVEISAPHRLEHFAASTPYMGFTGMLYLAQRLANNIAGRDHIRRIAVRK